MNLFKQIIADLRDEPVGQTPEEKNKYRWTIAAIMAGVAVALFFVFPLVAIVPAAVAVWKVKIALTDKS